VVNHLGIAWQATPIGAIDPEDFYDFQVNRPVVEIEDGRTQRLIWPTTRISLARAASADPTVPPTGLSRDIVLVHGIEPNMRWRAFSDELVQGLEGLGVKLIILLGALLADAPHTRPVPVSVGSSNSALAPDVGVGRVDYKGPTGIVGVLQHTCTGAGIPTVSLWAQVPHYVAQSPTTSGPWKRRRTPWICPRRAGTPSPASSSVTSGATAESLAVSDLNRGPGNSGPVRGRVGMHPVLQERVDPDLGGVDLARGEQRGKLGGQLPLLEHGVQPAQRLQ